MLLLCSSSWNSRIKPLSLHPVSVWEWAELGGGAAFPEAQFHLGLPEGHQQVTGLLGSGHLAVRSECRRENLAKEGEGEGRVETCLKGLG